MNCICLSSFMVCVHLRPYVWIYGFNEKNNTTPQNIYIYILSSWLGRGSHTFHHFPPSMSSLRIPKGLPHRHLRPFGIRRALRQFPASLQRPGVAGDAREAPRQAHHCGVAVDHRQVGRTTHGGWTLDTWDGNMEKVGKMSEIIPKGSKLDLCLECGYDIQSHLINLANLTSKCIWIIV